MCPSTGILIATLRNYIDSIQICSFGPKLLVEGQSCSLKHDGAGCGTTLLLLIIRILWAQLAVVSRLTASARPPADTGERRMPKSQAVKAHTDS